MLNSVLIKVLAKLLVGTKAEETAKIVKIMAIKYLNIFI
jgi:hypothetical protein